MRIIVLVKQTFDTEARIRLTPDGAIERSGVNLIINPFDEFAIEAAVRLKEAMGGEVGLVSVGPPEAVAALRSGLAMGADEAVLISDQALEGADEAVTARVLARYLAGREYDLILGGWRAVDDGSAQVGVRVAEILGLPHASMVQKIELRNGVVAATCQVEGYSEVVEVPLPAVLLAHTGLAEPRTPSILGVAKAKKKQIPVLSLGDLGLSAGDLKPCVKCLGYTLAETRRLGRLFKGPLPEAVRELVRALREEAGLEL